jgi:hypothetical protein
MDDWPEKIIDYERDRQELLLDRRDGIQAVHAYGEVPCVYPSGSVAANPEPVIPDWDSGS